MRKSRIIGGMVFAGSLALSHSFLFSKSPKTSSLFPLPDSGSNAPIDYSRFGSFEGINTPNYRYTMIDMDGLSTAAGIGVYPNERNLLRDPMYRKLQKTHELDGALNAYRPDDKPELSFYKWASMKGLPTKGLRQFNVARSLELGGHPLQALKAYYAVVVHFPKEICWQDGKPWYVGVSALDAVYRLLDQHPEWKISLRGGDIFVKNGFDRKGTNDAFYINPGTWVPGAVSRDRVELRDQKITLGGSNVQLVQWGNGHWQMLVKGQPYLIRGICYSPSPVGKTPDWGGFKPHSDWMNADTDNNKRADGPFDAWVDENLNNQRDDNEKAVGDFALMRDMGVNTVRLYHHGESKELLRTLEREYGIRVVMGDFLGAYTIGSDAEWDMGTDYTDPAQLEKMRASVRQMVTDHKDESYVLMWVLGNENNYGAGNNAPKQLAAYYQFVDSVAKMIREMDPTRPVAICNGDLENLDLLAANCPNVDVLAVNAYRGSYGMGESFWRAAARVWKKPVMISEFGCPAFNKNAPEKALTEQADYLVSNWNDIEAHIAGRRLGNSLGGVLFEWTDEWWKAGAETMVSEQDREPQSHGPFPDGNMYEEWLGLTSQGDGKSSPYMRQLRPAYFAFKNGPWKRDQKQAWKR